MSFSRRTLLKAGSLAALSLSLGPGHPSVARASSRGLTGRVKERIPTICGMCKAQCPMIALKTVDGHLRLTGNPKSPIHDGFLCARGMAAVQLSHDPDRLKYPLKRVGSRGSGAWKRISWQEAIAEISSRLKKAHADFGPDSLALLCGGSSSSFIRTLYQGLSCPHIYDSSRMHSAAIRELGYGTVFGRIPDPSFLPAMDGADCLVLMGCHLGENNQVAQLRQVTKFIDRGAELIVVDPRFSAMAAKADHYLAIKPGTDTALLMGWIHQIVSRDLYDPALAAQVVGLEELRQAVAPYTLARTSEITDLPADKILLAVETMVHAAPGAVIMPGSHLSWYGGDVHRVRAQAILTALLGGRPASTSPHFDFAAAHKPLSFADLTHQIGSRRIKVTGIWGQNPLQAEMAPYKTMVALKEADFIFACDVLPSEPTLYADIVLPECSFLERMDGLHTWNTGTGTMTGCRFPVVPAPHECRDPYQIVKDIADGCGYGELLAPKRIHNYLDGLLVARGSSLDALKRAGGLILTSQLEEQETRTNSQQNGIIDEADEIFGRSGPASLLPALPTPSGKIEFHSNWLAHNGYAPLPVYEPPAWLDGYLRLLYGRCPVHSLTRTAGFSWLNHEIPENELWLAESVAARQGLVDGDQVRLENSDGFRSLNLIRVKVTPGIREDCCYMSHGFGNRSPFVRHAYLRGVSDSALMSRGKVDPISGTRGMRDTFVRLLRGGDGA